MAIKQELLQEIENTPELVLTQVFNFLKIAQIQHQLETVNTSLPSISDLTVDATVPPVWQRVVELGQSVPAEVWATVPTDLSKNFDVYQNE